MSQDQPEQPYGQSPIPPAPGYQPPPYEPPPAQSPPGQPVVPGVGAGAQPMTQADERLWSMLGHLGGIVLGFLSPLLVWLVYRERSAFVNDQGREGLNFQITLAIGYFAAFILSFIGIGLLAYPVLWIGGLVFAIIAGLAANKGENYRYPVTLRLVK